MGPFGNQGHPLEDLTQRLSAMQEIREAEALENEKKMYAEQQMEFWPDDFRSAPNTVVRCAMFSTAKVQEPRLIYKELLIASQGNDEIYYTGEELDQQDFNTWVAVLQLFRERRMDSVITPKAIELINAIGLKKSGTAYADLEKRLQRLAFNRVDIYSEVRSKRRLVFFGSLIQSVTLSEDGTYWAIKLEPRLKALFSGGSTWVNWKIRKRLGRKALPLWLHGYYRSHFDPYPITIKKLQELTGTGTKDIRAFRQAVKRALSDLQSACAAEGVVFEWKHIPAATNKTKSAGGDLIEFNWITRESHQAIPNSRNG